ncbi:MAG: hypothetical protein QXZ66_07325 [Thermoproteota archaeon]
MILIMMVLAYLISAVLFSFYSILFGIFQKKLLEKKTKDLTDSYKEFDRYLKYRWKEFVGVEIVLLVFISVLIVGGIDIWVLLFFVLFLSMLAFVVVYFGNIRLLMKKFEKTKIISFIEFEAKVIGMWVFGFIGLFASFTLLESLFRTVTAALLLVDFHPMILINLGETFIGWVSDAYDVFFKLQIFGCLLIIFPYWIIRSSSYLVSHEYAIKMLSADLANFSLVFFVSQYLTWVAHGLTINGFLTSLLISLTSSILRELIREFLETKEAYSCS